jgi:hypothetical protein
MLAALMICSTLQMIPIDQPIPINSVSRSQLVKSVARSLVSRNRMEYIVKGYKVDTDTFDPLTVSMGARRSGSVYIRVRYVY